MKYVKVWAVDSSGVCKCGKGTDCPRPGKHPVGATWDAVDLEEFELDSAYNWGLVTGEVNGIFVVDCDVHGEVNGILAVGELGTLPTTHTVRTGSGGLHYYFKWPGTAIANSAAKLAPGVDIRGDGGYVLVPPSVNSKGPYTLVSNAPIAAAPAWLLERLSRPQAEETTQTVSLGEATPDDIAAARAEVLMMPRAISGQGGDDLTFRVAAVLANDYGLSEEEGFPIFAEWNARCEPPWGPAELKLKWRGGLKYATGRYGSKRTGGLRSAVKTLLDNWSSNNLGEAGLPALVKGLERAAREHTITDRTVLDALCAQVTKVTGLPAGKSGLKGALRSEEQAAGDAVDTRVVVPWSADSLPAATAAAEAALKARNVFRRGNVIVVPDNEGGVVGAGEPHMLLELCKAVRVTQYDAKSGETRTIMPPDRLVKSVLGNRHSTIPKVLGILTCPTLREDCSVLSMPGLDESTGLYLPEHPPMPPVGETREEAAAALARLTGLVKEMAFRDVINGCEFSKSVDLSVAVSTMMTAVCHGAYVLSPGHGLTAPSGTGKSYAVNLLLFAARGKTMSVSKVCKSEEEFEKRLDSAVLAGSPLVTLDNVPPETELSGASLCQALTEPVLTIRKFHTQEAPEIPKRMMILATGINLKIRGDNTRRWILCGLNRGIPNPQNHEYKYDPLAEVKKNRMSYVRDCLTIVRAHHVQRGPRVKRIGSFEGWSDTVRSSLMWLGMADPIASQVAVRETDSESAELSSVISGLRRLKPEWLRAKDIITAADDEEWLEAVAGTPPNAKRLSTWLKNKKDLPEDGYIIACKKDLHSGNTVFRVVPAHSGLL